MLIFFLFGFTFRLTRWSVRGVGEYNILRSLEKYILLWIRTYVRTVRAEKSSANGFYRNKRLKTRTNFNGIMQHNAKMILVYSIEIFRSAKMELALPMVLVGNVFLKFVEFVGSDNLKFIFHWYWNIINKWRELRKWMKRSFARVVKFKTEVNCRFYVNTYIIIL